MKLMIGEVESNSFYSKEDHIQVIYKTGYFFWQKSRVFCRDKQYSFLFTPDCVDQEENENECCLDLNNFTYSGNKI